MEQLRCKITGNICGTDTWERGKPCMCENCKRASPIRGNREMKQNLNDMRAQITVVLIDEIGAAMNMEPAEAKKTYLTNSWSGSHLKPNLFKARVDRATECIISLFTEEPD